MPGVTRRPAVSAPTSSSSAGPQASPANEGNAAFAARMVTGDPILQHGSRGESVTALQELLVARGYTVEVDGIFGDGTDAAVRKVQKRAGLGVDGIVGAKTAQALNTATAAPAAEPAVAARAQVGGISISGDPMLRLGSAGPRVEALQKLLIAKGGRCKADGDFGRNTDSAVRQFQAANGLGSDGIVGPGTAAALHNPSSKNIGSSPQGRQFAGADAYADERAATLAAAQSHLGAPYYWGADGPGMFDCSGFVLYVLRNDMGLVNWGDDNAHGLMGRLPKTTTPKAGDLVFFWSGGHVEHVMMATGAGSEEIGASGGGSNTRGKDPNACVKTNSWGSDRRGHTFGSIEKLISARR